jgi:cobalt-zinc-cadmium efflux system outer membrane protein
MHTDVLTAQAGIEKARYNLRLAQVTPYPDVNVQVGVQVDSSAPGPSRLISSIQFGGPVPVFDQNKGAIRQAQAALMRSNEEPHRVQADLHYRFAEAWRRYDEYRIRMQMHRQTLLPKQVQAFRASLKSHAVGGPDAGVAYSDLIASEQNLITAIGNYLTDVQSQWQAVVDVSSLLQTNQVYQMTDEINNSPAIDLEVLLKYPCNHPCSPALPAPTREAFRDPPSAPLSRQEATAPRPVVAFLPPAVLPVTAPVPADGKNIVRVQD